jgi:phosphorylated CTD-interacting factor 1
VLQRYDAVGGHTYQCSMTPEAFRVLREDFGVSKECFASPFNANAEVYWSAFPDTDCFFGSQGSFFEALGSPLVTAGGSFYANPPFVEEYMERLQRCVAGMLAWPVAVTFVVVLPKWSDSAAHQWFEASAHTKVHLVLLPEQHEYMDGRQHVGMNREARRFAAGFATSCFILQNELGGAQVAVDEQKRRRLRESFAVRGSTASTVCQV